MKPKYEIEEYVTSDDQAPFSRWLLGLKDKRAQIRLRARVTRASFGNFGDWKPIKGVKGLHEMREHHGPGYRIYYAVIGQTIVLLLAGSSKKDQTKTIAQAKEWLADYEQRRSP